MENHHFIAGKIHYKWQFSIAMFDITRGYPRKLSVFFSGGWEIPPPRLETMPEELVRPKMSSAFGQVRCVSMDWFSWENLNRKPMETMVYHEF